MTVEELLRQAMADQAGAVPAPADRWAGIEAQAAAARRATARRRSRSRMGGLTILGVAAGVAALIAVTGLTGPSSHRVAVTPGHQPTVVTPQVPPATGISPTTAPTIAPTTAVPAGSAYLPLYPFVSLQQANAWQADNKATGVQPWHLDAGQTALNFSAFLGYTDITKVLSVKNDSTGAHVTVGFPNPNGGSIAAAVVHLRRFGTGPNAPWEVVGTDDTASFSVTTPRYGAPATSPLSVGGAIVGVDENIRVEVLQLSSAAPVGTFCCLPAGNSGAPWHATVTVHGATDKVLIVSASTGGGLVAVGRFAVTGIRTSPGTTPGL